MNKGNLATYLNDHLAGAGALLELMEHVQSWYAGSDVAREVAELHAEVSEDRAALTELMDRLGINRSLPRRLAGWLAEKAAQLKLKLDDPGAKALRLLESAEAMSIGIEGKRLLWVSLSAVSRQAPELADVKFGYAVLERRAVDQRSRVEALRVLAATAALA